MQNVRKATKKKSFLGRLVSGSLLVSVLSFLSESFSAFIGKSFVSRLFNRSEKLDRSVSESFVSGTVRAAALSGGVGKLRHVFASGVESSVTVGWYRRLCGAIASASVRSLAVLLLSWAFYAALACAVHVIRGTAIAHLYKDIVFIGLTFVSSLFLLISKKSLGAKFCQSTFLSFIFFDALGINRMAVKTDSGPENRFALAFFGGLALGLASYFLSAVTVLALIVQAALLAVILYSPESGLLATVLLVPAANMNIVYYIIAATLASYLLKLMRGKRNFTFKSEDVAALFTAIVFSAAFRPEGAARTVMTVCVFFLASNLLRSADLLRKSAVCLTLGLGISAVFGAAESIAVLFGRAPGAISSLLPLKLLLHDPLLTVISVIWVFCVMSGRCFKMPSVIKVILFSAVLLEAAFSLSDAVIAAVLAGAFVFFAFRSGRLFNVMFAYLLALPALWFIRFLVTGVAAFEPIRITVPDVSGLTTVQLLFGGAPCGDNLYAAFIGAFGVMGCILTAIMLYMLLSRTLLSAPAHSEGMRGFCAAAVASVTVILLMGTSYNTLGSVNYLILFWTICGMASATGNATPRHDMTDEFY